MKTIPPIVLALLWSATRILAAESPSGPAASVSSQPSASTATTPGSLPAAAGLTGKFYAMVNATEHTWDFVKDGTYLHRTIASGGSTHVSSSERGTFTVSADKRSIELRTTKVTGAYSTPTVGGRGTALGAGTNTSAQVRVLSLNMDGPKNTHGTGIVLDGVAYNVRPW